MKKYTIFCVLALLCLYVGALAQAPGGTGREMKVGDKVPEAFWLQEHLIYENGAYARQSLAKYRDSLLILDYWATWCGSCVVKFPELYRLQQHYGGKLKVMLVNPASYRDTPEKIEKLFSAKYDSNGYRLPSIVQDTVLVKQFTPVQLPQNIWIINGYVRAITTAEYTNESTIATVIANYQRVAEKAAEVKARAREQRSKMKN